ncbi:MAG TPA: PAS domain S-box protein [Candidatus Obscuribacterales bacterium]
MENAETTRLLESEECFRLVLEASPDGFTILHSVRDAVGAIADFSIAYINPIAARGVNRTPEELVGQHLLQLFPECKTSGLFDRYLTVAETGISATFETFYDSKDLTGWFRNAVVKLNDGIAVSLSNITDRKRAEQRRDTQYAIARTLAEAATVAEATPAILQALCENLGWQVGVLWRQDPHHPILRCVNCWQSPTVDLLEFVEATQQMTFAQNVGLPGRVWASRQPIWISELGKDHNFPRTAFASQSGLQSGFGFPIRLGDEILGVIECFSNCIQEPDADLLHTIAAIGSQIGQFMERKRTETALRESQDLFHSFMNHSPIAAFIKDAAGRHLYVNSSVEQLLQRSQDEVVGKTDFELFPLEAAQQWRENDRVVMSSGQVLQTLETIHLEDGEHAYMSFKFPFRNALGEQLLAGVAIDVTDRVQAEVALRDSEAKFQAIVRNLPGMVYRYAPGADGKDTFTYVSSGSLELLELEPETIVQDSASIWSLFHPDDLPSLRESVTVAVENLLPWQWEGRLITPSGQLKWIQGRSRPEQTEHGVMWDGLLLDISDRKQAQQELQQALQTLQTIVAASPLPIIVIQPNLTVQLWNPAAAQVFGWSETEVLGQLLPIVPPEKQEECRLLREAVVRGEVFFGVETYRHKRDGSSVVLSISAAPLYSKSGSQDSGSVDTILLILQDITERQQAEQALRESEEWARLAIQVGRLGGWRLHLDTNLVEMDERMREIWGEPKDTVMVPLPKVIERMHPDDRERVTSAVSDAIAPQSLGTYEIEYRIVWNDGTERWVSANGQVQFEGEGKLRQPIDFFGTAIDITERMRGENERKQAEEALRNSAQRLSVALTAAKLGDWSWDAATDIVTFSEQAAEVFGIPSGPYMTWTQMQTLLHVEDRDRTRLQVERAIAEHSDYDVEYRVIHPDGTQRWVAAKGRAQYDSSGQVLGMLGVVQDITHRKQAEAERERLLVREQVAREEAETANRIKDEFLAVLSHELRSPLNPILGWAKLLRSRKLDEKTVDRALETIERNAALQTQLIGDLLDVSRILQGKLSLNIAPVDLAATITAAMETVRLAAEAKSIQIHTLFDGDIRRIAGDSARLQQVIWNLLSNAVKFTPEGGKVNIQLQYVGSHAQITVSDTGKGISPDFLPYVFDYFRQADSATTRKFGGLGLGLAIVRYLVELHGGTIKVESLGEGQGATFTVWLPLMKQAALVDQNPVNALTDVATTSPLMGWRILLVDDDSDTRDYLTFVLEQAGATVSVATSAAEALQALGRSIPNILLSDIGMPEMDGYTLMRQIRSRPPEQGGEIVAIALTAYAGEMNQQQALSAGFQQHLAKPVEPEILLQTITSLCAANTSRISRTE